MERNDRFWAALDGLVNTSALVIDRPRGTAHPRYPGFVYPVDYGYLNNTTSMDGGGIDLWRGTDPSVGVDAIVCTVDLMKRDSEIKILLHCSEEEKKLVFRTHNETEYMKAVLLRRKEPATAFFCELETERLWLKNISAEDRQFVFCHFSDEAVCRYLFDAEPMNRVEEADALIRLYTEPEPRSQHRWVIMRKSDGKKIGTCGFHCWDKQNRCVEVGYDLEEPSRGQGIMAEAMTAMLSVYAGKMCVQEIRAHIFTENRASLRLAKRLGFVTDGETVTYTFRGTEVPHDVFVLHGDSLRKYVDNQKKSKDGSDGSTAKRRTEDAMLAD